jgi:hypothetical protein
MDKPKLTRAEAARQNGARSQGPKSADGKARSSQNARKHGLSAKTFLVSPDEQDAFDFQLAALRDFWDPQSAYEDFLVVKLARAEFMHTRAEDIQNNLIEVETDIIAPEIYQSFEAIDAQGALTLGYRSLNDSSSAHRNIDRHLARLSRECIRAREAIQLAIAIRRERDATATPQPQQQPQAEPIAPTREEAPELQKEPNATPRAAVVRPIHPEPAGHPTPQTQTQNPFFTNEPKNNRTDEEDFPLCPAA